MAYKNIKNIITNNSYKLFREKGYDNVSVNEICSTSTITKPTFYYHFKAKEDILFAYYENVITEAVTSMNESKDVISCFEFIFEIFTGLGYDFVQNLLTASMRNIEKALVLPDDIRKYITNIIKKGQKDGSISSLHKAEKIYETCHHIFFGYILFWCQHNGLMTEYHSLTDALNTYFNLLPNDSSEDDEDSIS